MKDAEDSFHASLDAIRELQPVLVMDNDGEMLSEETWSEEHIERELAIRKTIEDAAIAPEKSTLTRNEHLQCVTSSRTRMRRRTLMDLPNELILLIFNFTQLQIDGLRHLLLVSRRLRQLALSSPRLWARQMLTPRLSPYTIDAIVRRSSRLGLQAEFTHFPGSSHAIFRDCERWTDLFLRGFSSSEIRRFQSTVPCTRLAGLESMDVSDSSDRLIILESNWLLPSLKTLRCRCVMPLGVQSSVLSECSLQFHHYLRIDLLALSLSASPCLERLSIDLSHVVGADAAGNPIQATLPALRNFTLSADNVHGGIITLLLDTILFPDIEYYETVCSATQVSKDDGVARFEAHIRGTRTRYPNLKAAVLKADCSWVDDDEELGVITIIDILKELPSSIQELKLCFNDILLQVHDQLVPDIGTWPNLQWIGFSECYQLTPRFFDDLGFLIKSFRMKNLTVDVWRCFVERDEDTEHSDNEVEKSASDDGDLLSLVGFIEHEVLQTMRAS